MKPIKSIDDLDRFTRAYLEAALWASMDDANDQGGEPLDANYDITDIPLEYLQKAFDDCQAFQDANAALLEQAGDSEQNGYDYFLTRNHHGAGFWDRGYPKEIGDALTLAAHNQGEIDFYVGDDGKIYF